MITQHCCLNGSWNGRVQHKTSRLYAQFECIMADLLESEVRLETCRAVNQSQSRSLRPALTPGDQADMDPMSCRKRTDVMVGLTTVPCAREPCIPYPLPRFSGGFMGLQHKWVCRHDLSEGIQGSRARATVVSYGAICPIAYNSFWSSAQGLTAFPNTRERCKDTSVLQHSPTPGNVVRA